MCNEAGAWGVIKNKELLIGAGVFLLLLISYFWYNSKSKIIRLGLALILLGGVLNIGERLFFGCVRDYWKIISWWPTFNAADVLIAFGLIMVILVFLKSSVSKFEKK